MPNHEHKWKFLRTERWEQKHYGSWLYDQAPWTDKWTNVFQVCSKPTCFATQKLRKDGFWYNKDFAGK